MREELAQRLVKRYPSLYAQRRKPMVETCMCWGFECGDGWFTIIDELSKGLEAWNTLNPDAHVEAVQVKEKYGTLRFYTSASNDEVERLITEAEEKSAVTCEVCGKPGKVRGGGWILTLCDEHAPLHH